MVTYVYLSGNREGRESVFNLPAFVGVQRPLDAENPQTSWRTSSDALPAPAPPPLDEDQIVAAADYIRASQGTMVLVVPFILRRSRLALFARLVLATLFSRFLRLFLAFSFAT